LLSAPGAISMLLESNIYDVYRPVYAFSAGSDTSN
jgi:hypothetical protein